MKRIFKSGLCALLTMSLCLNSLAASPRVIYDMAVKTDHKAEVTLKWNQASTKGIRLKGFEVLDNNVICIYYEEDATSEKELSFFLRLEQLDYPAYVQLKTSEEEVIFTDVNQVGESKLAILNLYGRGIVNGYEGNVFKPDANVKGEEFAIMLMKAAGIEVDQEAELPSGMEVSTWAEGYVATLYKMNVINSDFKSKDNMTMGDMAMAVNELFTFYQLTSKQEGEGIKGHISRHAMHNLYEADVIKNTDMFYNNPERVSTREDCSLILNRVIMSYHDVQS